jgi:hypothetical protein
VEGGGGLCPACPGGGGGPRIWSPTTCLPGEGFRVHTHCPHDQGRPWNLLHVVGGPWNSLVAVLDKVQ